MSPTTLTEKRPPFQDGQDFIITSPLTIDEGCSRILNAGLIDDEATSDVLRVIGWHPDETDRSQVLQIWIATDDTGKDIGMAIVSAPADFSFCRNVLNLFVDWSHRGKGVGQALLEAVSSRHDLTGLSAHYTPSSVHLYRAKGLRPCCRFTTGEIAELRRREGDAVADARYIELVALERQEEEREFFKASPESEEPNRLQQARPGRMVS